VDAFAEAAATTTDSADGDAPTLLTEDELEVLVARIAAAFLGLTPKSATIETHRYIDGENRRSDLLRDGRKG
jgi:predicted patatin/cPLA2 family phospholipase